MEVFNQQQMSRIMPAAWQHDKALGDCMIELYENNLWTDVKFRCSDHDEHERIHAHKIVLAARSPVFQAMFFGPCVKENEEVVLDNTEIETFDLFLRYIYQDKVTMTEDIAASVLETAHFYQVTNLVLYCADYLARCITSQNVCEILSLARRYELVSLCQACCNFIDDNADEVLESEGFLKLTEDTFAYIFKGDTFYADEVEIFKKAEEWAKKKIEESNLDNHGQNIRKVLGSSFFHLRLPTMTLENLLKCTCRKGFFTIEEYEDLVAFINKTPGINVTSNSCIRRLPKEEIVNFTTENGRKQLKHKIETSFTISLSRHVKVKTITLTKIYPHTLCEYYKLRSIIDDKESYYLNDLEKNGCINTLREIIPKIPCEVEGVISGHLKVTCHKVKETVEAGTNNEEINNENKKLKEYVIFEKDLMLICTDKIHFEEPLILDKTRSPYKFTFNLEFRNASSVQMGTIYSAQTSFKSKHGIIEVKNTGLYGNCACIQSICFENISNRDEC